VLQGEHAITAPLAAADSTAIEVAVASMLTLEAGFTLQPGVQVTRTGIGSLVVAGGLTLNAGASFEVNEGAVRADRITGGILRLGGTGDLTLDPPDANSPPSKVAALEIAGMPGGFAGKLDLTDSAIIIQAADAQAAAFALEEATAQAGGGRNDGTQGPWTGRGITSIVAAAGLDDVHGVAVILNDNAVFGDSGPIFTSFRGEAVDTNSVIAAFTLNGDVDLDGKITARDYFAIDAGRAMARLGYGFGDFHYSGGPADAVDYMLIDRAFLWQHEAAAPGAPAAAVPEPAALISLLGALALGRRSRKSS
jgi:hypothetical protein